MLAGLGPAWLASRIFRVLAASDRTLSLIAGHPSSAMNWGHRSRRVHPMFAPGAVPMRIAVRGLHHVCVRAPQWPGRTSNGGTNDSIHVPSAALPLTRASWTPAPAVAGCRRGDRRRACHHGRGRLLGWRGTGWIPPGQPGVGHPGRRPLTDPDLLNAWGLAATPGTDQAPGSPLWVSDNGSGKTTLFAGATADSVAQVLVVNI